MKNFDSEDFVHLETLSQPNQGETAHNTFVTHQKCLKSNVYFSINFLLIKITRLQENINDFSLLDTV